jgi:hypothetical protein
MLVGFLRDFRGKLTKENYYTAGDQVEFDAGTAQALIDQGIAVAVVPEPIPEIAPTLPKPTPRRRQTGGGVL